MASLILDERDQQFVLYELLEVEKLCDKPLFGDFSSDMFDMILSEAQKFAVKDVYPATMQGDKEGCRLKEGQVYVPEAFHRLYRLYCEGGWNAMSFPVEAGGQGLPLVISTAARAWFTHNMAFSTFPGLTQGAAHLIEVHGTEEQKEKYLEKMLNGQWTGTMCLTEPQAGTDVGSLTTKAIRQPDGTFKIQGTKIFITCGDNDLAENVIHPVLARIEGDIPGSKGISLFVVPKYVVEPDGSLGRRNDWQIAKIEEKLGIHGSPTCLINFGDNGECYGELLGGEREGMRVMFQMMNEARIGVGMQGAAGASVAYLHALQYAKERLQGAAITNWGDPDAPRVPIIQHPDVRRMLLWMKCNVESMMALIYFTAYCRDRVLTEEDEVQKQYWQGLIEVLTPVCKAYNSDVGFRVTENALQVYGGYGYCADYPVEQFLRDEKIASIYEGTNGIQALDLVGRKLGLEKGAYFMNLLAEMGKAIGKYKNHPELKSLAEEVESAVNKLADIGLFFAKCAKVGKFLIPVSNAYPFLMMMGKVVSGWLLLWEAGVAKENLDRLTGEKGVDPSDRAKWEAFMKDSKDGAFYAGKIASATYFVKNVLPEVDAAARAIKSEDMSVMEIAEESFAA